MREAEAGTMIRLINTELKVYCCHHLTDEGEFCVSKVKTVTCFLTTQSRNYSRSSDWILSRRSNRLPGS